MAKNIEQIKEILIKYSKIYDMDNIRYSNGILDYWNSVDAEKYTIIDNIYMDIFGDYIKSDMKE